MRGRWVHWHKREVGLLRSVYRLVCIAASLPDASVTLATAAGERDCDASWRPDLQLCIAGRALAEDLEEGRC